MQQMTFLVIILFQRNMNLLFVSETCILYFLSISLCLPTIINLKNSFYLHCLLY